MCAIDTLLKEEGRYIWQTHSSDTYYNIPLKRNPIKPGNIKAYKHLKKTVDEENYNMIHCHTPVGALLTMDL